MTTVVSSDQPVDIFSIGALAFSSVAMGLSLWLARARSRESKKTPMPALHHVGYHGRHPDNVPSHHRAAPRVDLDDIALRLSKLEAELAARLAGVEIGDPNRTTYAADTSIEQRMPRPRFGTLEKAVGAAFLEWCRSDGLLDRDHLFEAALHENDIHADVRPIYRNRNSPGVALSRVEGGDCAKYWLVLSAEEPLLLPVPISGGAGFVEVDPRLFDIQCRSPNGLTRFAPARLDASTTLVFQKGLLG